MGVRIFILLNLWELRLNEGVENVFSSIAHGFLVLERVEGLSGVKEV